MNNKHIGNTVGSHNKASFKLSSTQTSFIAGFLEGDGCISAKISVNRQSQRLGYQIKTLVSFTQKP